MKTQILCILAVATTLLTACQQSADSAWQTARQTNTEVAYDRFIAAYPGDARIKDARMRIAEIKEPGDWSRALQENTRTAYQRYLSAHENGLHAAQAHQFDSALERETAWQSAQEAGTPEAIRQFIDKYQSGPTVDAARAQLVKLDESRQSQEAHSGNFRVQLGAFRTKRAAWRARRTLAEHYSDSVGKIDIIAPGSNSSYYRLRSAALTHEAAQAACSEVKHDGRVCAVIDR